MVKKIKITAILWDIYASPILQAGKNLKGVEVVVFPSRKVERLKGDLKKIIQHLEEAKVILLYRSTESFWEELEEKLKQLAQEKPVISLSANPSYWLLSSVKPEVVATSYKYLIYGGEKNFRNLLLYILNETGNASFAVEPPELLPWEGIYHPKTSKVYKSLEEYSEFFKFPDVPRVGIVFSRSYWVNGNTEFIDCLAKGLERRELLPIPVFTYSVRDENLGSKSTKEVMEKYFVDKEGKNLVEAVIKLTPLFAGGENTDDSSHSIDFLKRLNVPIFQPLLSSYKTKEEWEKDPHGLGRLTAWYVTLPEFEGVIEPIILGVAGEGETMKKIEPLSERCSKIAERVSRWVKLRRKPIKERKVAFILHNNPCASVEATVGGAANLDSLESVTRIMKSMKKAGYVVNSPENGKKLIEEILKRKAISEFRWTTVEEIVKKEGALKLIPTEDYLKWFDTLSQKFKERINEVWGEPPGKEMHGVPAAMIYKGKIVVTGVNFGNAVVCVQPKRGCAGPRCDGKVCKILHDPDIPPPHQYFATYRYLEYDFGADCVIHVGTHGNLEFLPGKGVGLSGECSPDIAIGNLPHLYIYNSDNPPEGAIAKRRSYATLIDHMQAVMVRSGLEGGLEEVERLLEEYYRAENKENKSLLHSLKHSILKKMEETSLNKEIEYKPGIPFERVVKNLHEKLNLIKSSQINDGLHIFGEIPEGERKFEFIRSMFSFDTEELNLRTSLFKVLNIDLTFALSHIGEFYAPLEMSYGDILDFADRVTLEFIRRIIEEDGKPLSIIEELLGEKIKRREYLGEFLRHAEKIKEIDYRMKESKEIDSFLSGLNGKFIPPGPSGKITRGRYEILPTGRNFYTLDIRKLPTKSAYETGKRLAEGVIQKHLNEEGRLPENIALYWTCMDITCSDGEGMAQIMNLLGARPRWRENGMVDGFEVIPLKELGRPRIDVTIRVGGILRDNFPNCMEYIDKVIRSVANLDEPVEMNFVRKHALKQLEERKGEKGEKELWEEVITRIFGSKPGTYMAGTNLAVYASAWKEEKDLSDVFIYWNRYAYGEKIFGKESTRTFTEVLKTVDITFNKAYTDEYDLFGCCCYFATQGGMTNAARCLSGKPVKAYYGDTRDLKNVSMRSLKDEVRRVVRSKILNPKWIEGMKRHGYKGLGDISKRIGRIYGWEATTGEVDDWIFDEIARTYALDKEMRKFFEENNPYALEEIARRLLEAYERKLWKADPELIEKLKESYLEIESWLEEEMGEVEGEFQGGSVDILTMEDVKEWGEKMREIRGLIKK